MCSNIEGGDLLADEITFSNHAICKKCGNASFVKLQKKDVLCKDCFYNLCRHKFRATIGKSKLIKKQSKVLIAFSGGSSSRAMLDLTINSINTPKSYKKLKIEPSFLYIEEIIYNETEEFTLEIFENIKTIMLATSRKCLLSSIEMLFSNEKKYCELKEDTKYFPLKCINGKKRIKKVLSNIESMTSKEEWIRNLKLHLIQEIAANENVDFIFLGSNITTLAIGLIADIAQGKGAQISYCNSFDDTRFRVPILRPMREFLRKEITFFNIMRGNRIIERQNLTSKLDNKSSILKLTESFIINMEDNFPATVFTIFNIGDKVTSNACESRCNICNSFLDKPSLNECSAYSALELSRRLSKSTKYASDVTKNWDNLCYGCSILMQEYSEEPTDILFNEIQKQEIKDFLL